MSRPAVIVPAYRAAHLVATTAPAFRAQTVAADWIFVDDGSEDETSARLADALAGPWACPESTSRVLRLAQNGGRARARNAGLAAAAPESDPIVFLDVDVEPPPDLLESFCEALQEDEALAVVARIVPASADPRNPYHRYLASSLRGPGATAGPVSWRFFLTTAAAVRRPALDAAGGFDGTVTYGEDLDLAARLAQLSSAGLRVAHSAPVRMHDAGDLGTALQKVTEYGRDNLPAMIARHPDLADWTRADWLTGRDGSWTGRLVNAALRPRLARWVRDRVDVLPAWMSDIAVRYVLAAQFAEAYRSGLTDIDLRESASIDLTDVPDASMEASRWIEGVLERWTAPPELVDRAVLALSEAVANVVEHGRPPLSIQASRSSGVVRLTVREGGPGAPSAALDEASLPDDATATHGRGLYLIRTLTDGVELQEGRLQMLFRPRSA